MIRFCIGTSAYVSYDNRIFKQKQGLAMGNPLSGVLADIVLDEIIKMVVGENGFDILLFVKYVDDILIIADQDDVEDIFRAFNSASMDFVFTMEIEEENQIPYLDVSLIHQGERIISKWYRKPTNKGRILDFWSSHPRHMKDNCVRSFANKVLSYSHESFHPECIDIIKQTLKINHYPQYIVRKTINYAKTNYNKPDVPQNTVQENQMYASIRYCPPTSSCIKKYVQEMQPRLKICEKPIKKLKEIVFSKTSTVVPLLKKRNVVYKINCLNCEKCYIGHTGKRLEQRIQQHKNDCRLRRCRGTGTALSTHALELQHTFDFDQPEILESETNYSKRVIKEAIQIKKHENMIVNYRVDCCRIHPSYESSIT